MKKTDLVKNLEKKIKGKMQASGVPGRFAEGAAQVPDRREQRKLDQAAGLVPFAVKLHGDLVKQLQALAAAEGGNLNALVDRLVRAALVGQPAAGVSGLANTAAAPEAALKKAPAEKAAAEKAEATKVPAKKAPAKKTSAKKTAAKAADKTAA